MQLGTKYALIKLADVGMLDHSRSLGLLFMTIIPDGVVYAALILKTMRNGRAIFSFKKSRSFFAPWLVQ